MPNITLSVDDETFTEMKRHKDIKWSEVARQAFRRKLTEVHLWDHLLKDSDLTMDDAIALGDEAKRDMADGLGW